MLGRLLKNRNRNYEIDMTSGNILPKVIWFTVPLMLTSILQLLYNAADVIVVGRFTGAEALAAVGSTGSLINLIVNVFLGLSVGTNVIAANNIGARDFEGTQDTVHTSIAVSLIGGVILGVFGFAFGGTFLKWMGSPEDVLPLATTYIKIFFLGMPFNMLYNFGAAVLRAVGDTRRPLYFLSVAGAVNVVLNLIFVIKFHMGVAGVAWATIISQMISAVLVLICLVRTQGYVHLDLKKLRVRKKNLLEMTRVGLPAGFQGACFSISNVLIQSTVNSYGAIVVAGNSASQNLENFIYVSMNALHQSAVTFVSANIGAGRNDRIRKCMGVCVFLVVCVGLGMGLIALPLMRQLLGVYSPDSAVVEAGVMRLRIFCLTYFTCGIMDVLCGSLRGMGTSVVPMIVSILGSCVLRIVWIYTVLPLFPDPEFRRRMLYMSYPISWVLTSTVHLICCLFWLKKYPVKGELKGV